MSVLGQAGLADGGAMRAVTWQGTHQVSVEQVPDPVIEQPTDAIVRITSTAICGSDLHLYEPLAPFMRPGDVLGHEPMGVVEEVGAEVTHIKPGDRVVVPFNIACGHCWMCSRQLYAQCETTQNTEHGTGASLFGYSVLYGAVPGGQAEYLRVPQAQFGPIKVPQGGPDERYLYLSDVVSTAWQGVVYAEVPRDGTVAVFGLGPIGQLATRIARHRGAGRVIGLDLVPERLAMAARHGVETVDVSNLDGVPERLAEMTGGRGPDSVVEAVGMEAHGGAGAGIAKGVQRAVGLLPDAVARKATEAMGVDRTTALVNAMKSVRRGGTLSISGVYGGETDPLPMMELFDRGIQVRMGQAHVRRWTDAILPLLADDADPLGVLDLATHQVPLTDAPRMYELFQQKEDGCIKVVLKP